MTDRGPTYLNLIEVDAEHRPAVLAVLAEHFEGTVEGDEVIVNAWGSPVTICDGVDGEGLTCDDMIDNQDSYGAAEQLQDALIEAGASKVNFGLRLYDYVYQFRSRGSEKRVDVANDDGEFFVTESQLDKWLAEDGITIDGLKARLAEHFGTGWP